MENEYYLPNIEEMTVGDAVQIYCNSSTKLIDSKKWHDVVITPNYNHPGKFIAMNRIPNLIKSKLIRIKYLNRTAIESLSWKVRKEPCRWQFEDISGRYKLITALYTEKDGTFDPSEYIIIQDTRDGDNYTIFYGWIKNKSEFKKIMSQLKIN